MSSTITTPAQAAAMPVGSVIADQYGITTAEKLPNGEWMFDEAAQPVRNDGLFVFAQRWTVIAD